jgi:hypothetical protein
VRRASGQSTANIAAAVINTSTSQSVIELFYPLSRWNCCPKRHLNGKKASE